MEKELTWSGWVNIYLWNKRSKKKTCQSVKWSSKEKEHDRQHLRNSVNCKVDCRYGHEVAKQLKRKFMDIKKCSVYKLKLHFINIIFQLYDKIVKIFT